MNQFSKMNDYFKTPDLNLCSTLQYLGFRVEVIDRDNPSRVIFYIKRENDLDDVIQAFWAKQLQVEPVAYFDTLKQIKSRIYHDN
jgi:hypothetical protein